MGAPYPTIAAIGKKRKSLKGPRREALPENSFEEQGFPATDRGEELGLADGRKIFVDSSS